MKAADIHLCMSSVRAQCETFLFLPQPEVRTAGLKKCCVVPALHDRALVHNKDDVGMCHGSQTMRRDNDRSAVPDSRDDGIQGPFGNRIKVMYRLIH